MATIRFCAYQYQHLPFDQLFERWRRAEELGFDVVWNVDTVVEPDRPGAILFDGPTTLAAMALRTSTIRIGTLVTSLYFRSPVLAARAAIAVDHLSDGRVEVALGAGDPAAGPAAAGVRPGLPADQVARFREFVEIIDQLLRNDVTTYAGRFFWCEAAETIPGPVQRPRPPITVAAHGPRMLRVAADFADAWSSWGGYGIDTEEQFLSVTRERAARFDDLCVERRRDPKTIRHSLVCFPPLTPWESIEYFRNMVGTFNAIGIDEFVLYWPQSWRDAPHEGEVFEDVAPGVMSEIRSGSVGSVMEVIRMVICIFGNTIVKAGKEDEEAQLVDKLEPILRSMPGFISWKSYTAEDGEEVSLIRFDSRESLDAWAHEGLHLQTQKMAPEIYERFWIQDVETYREYTWEHGVHTDRDLTELFLEG